MSVNIRPILMGLQSVKENNSMGQYLVILNKMHHTDVCKVLTNLPNHMRFHNALTVTQRFHLKKICSSLPNNSAQNVCTLKLLTATARPELRNSLEKESMLKARLSPKAILVKAI